MAKRWGLAMGLNYPNTSNALNGCVEDATDLNACMHGGVGVANAQEWMKLLGAFDGAAMMTNAQCTKASMVTAISNLLDKAQSGDLAVISYSGHGTLLPPGLQSWVPHDFDWNNHQTWLSYDELDHIFLTHERRGVTLVVLSDSCHSQADPTKHFREFGVPNAHPTKNRFLEPPQFIKDAIVADPFDRNVLTSDQDDLLLAGCAKDQTSADAYIDEKYHGAFTYALLHALKANPNATYREVVLRARAYLASNGYDQVCSGNGASSILGTKFFRTVTPPRDGECACPEDPPKPSA